jgi:hypothetical protein
MDDDAIELTEFISALRHDLTLSIAGSAGDSLRFALDDIELELELKAGQSRDTRVGGKLGVLKFWVVGGAEVSGERKTGRTQGATHRLKLRLKPVWQNDPRYSVLVAAASQLEPRWSSGEAAAGAAEPGSAPSAPEPRPSER